MRRFLYLYALLALTIGQILIVAQVSAQSIAVIDYPAAVILHPLMSTYNFQKGAFERSPLFATGAAYEEWSGKASKEVAALRDKYKAEYAARKGKLERVEKTSLQTREKFNETLGSLSGKFDKLRTSDKAEDKATLAKVRYGEQIKGYEEKFREESLAMEQAVGAARAELKDIEDLMEAPRFTPPTETQQTFGRIESEIVAAAQYVMRGKGCTILLNSAGMGMPAPHTPIENLDPALIARHSDLELELYKNLLSSNVSAPAQTYPNADYQKQIDASVYGNKVASLRKSLQARSGLRLVEPDLTPRVLSGGVAVTMDTVNYILFQYKVPDAQRGIIIQVLREMNIQ